MKVDKNAQGYHQWEQDLVWSRLSLSLQDVFHKNVYDFSKLKEAHGDVL